MIALGLMASGCAGFAGDGYGTSDYSAGSPGYYQYQQPYYAAPYPHYAAPYPPGYYYNQGAYGGGWRDHEWRGQRADGFRGGGYQHAEPHPGSAAHMPSQPMHLAPAAPPPAAPPPAAPPQAAQNKALLDQLGFRPSR
jgi:hypothetical protein